MGQMRSCSSEVPGNLGKALENLHSDAWKWALICAGKDRTVAEDVLQSAYLAVLEGKALFDGRSSFRTWLFGVIRFTAKNVRRRDLLLSVLFERVQHEAAAPQSAELEATQLLSTRAWDSLSSRQRQVIALVFQHDLGLDEAATVMGISAGAARQHYERAKKKLRNVHDRELRDE